MSVVKVIAESSESCLVQATSPDAVFQIWFKTPPVDRTFCYRAVQVQLQTDSSDHGHNDQLAPGCWSWFEVAIYASADATEPHAKDGKDLVWRSHWNRMDPDDSKDSISRHFGYVFDRRHEIFEALEVGNVIGVRVCAQNAGWMNYARAGKLSAKLLDHDLFSPMAWALTEGSDMPADIPDTIEDGVYTLTTSEECHLHAKSDEQTDTIWFTTPVLEDFIISRIQDIQLFTFAHNQGEANPGTDGIWSWFDLVILETPESRTPRIKDGRALVWRSHNVPITSDEDAEQTGKLFNLSHEIFSNLEPGNVIAVRPCTRFAGWQLHAHSARLVVRISNKGPRKQQQQPKVDWEAVSESTQKLQDALANYLDELTPEGKPPAVSVEAALLGQEIRSDREYGSNMRPLRLLSLDGGGVRGISSLHILKTIMAQVAGDPNAKPCDYFDMMAGTSTGGLIAIMLGRLRMSIDECLAEYEGLAKEIFGSNIFGKIDNASDTGARYSPTILEDRVKRIVKQRTGNPDEPMRDPKDECKVFVLTCRADDLSNSIATHLRTYTNKNVEKSFADYKIWEAARATSAAPTYFPRIKLGDHEYVDGGLGFNNPVLLLLGEARVYYGFARPIGCLVTIGTGMNPNVVLPDTSSNALGNLGSTAVLLKRMWELVTLTEHAHQMAQSISEPGSYFRFNIGKKLAEKRWIETVAPSVFDRWFHGAKDQQVERYTPENWAQVTIALDDYKGMADFVTLTLEFMKTEVEKTKNAAGKLPPKRIPAAVVKQ
ncbi:hypothetical protein H1R20_g15995, partial [Candolleomyces eurysporus]